MRQLILLAAAALSLLVSACNHRQYYRDVVGSSATEKEITFLLKNAKTGEALPGVTVRVAAGYDRVMVVTDKQGRFTLPVKKSLMDPYTVIEVIRPSGVEGYTIERAAAVAPPVAPTSAVAPVEGQASDAGA